MLTKRLMEGRREQQTGPEPLSASWRVTAGVATCGVVAVWRSCSAVRGYNTEVSDGTQIMAFWVGNSVAEEHIATTGAVYFTEMSETA